MLKYIQRRSLTFLNTWSGFAFIVILTYALLAYTITLLYYNPCIDSNSNNLYCSKRNYYDNIGNINVESELAYGPIDVVYTWVNGSDSRWLAKKEKWLKIHLEKIINNTLNNNNNNNNNNTNNIYIFHQSNNSITNDINNNHTFMNNIDNINHNNNSNINIMSNISSTINDNDTYKNSTNNNDNEEDISSSNRYRDSEELRYSLRSLFKNAPWIRHIYIVTDNQIPYWLNMEHERLTVVSHNDIFLNKSHLPVFSSPAIEANIHHIPGLSKQFIYFNDDVFLGAKTHPDDFVSLLGIPKFYLSWEVPKCASGCSDSWIGDGYCDKACNVSACDFDFPDCINSTLGIGTVNNNNNKPTVAFCARGCPHTWLGDKVCDLKCKSHECGWDLGDCGLDMLTEFESVTLSYNNSNIIKFQRNNESFYNVPEANNPIPIVNDTKNNIVMNSSNVNSSSMVYVPTTLRVPYGTKFVYFNISRLACYALYSDECPEIDLKLDKLLEKEKNDDNRNSTVDCNFNDFMITTVNYNFLQAGRENSLVQSFTVIKRNQMVGVVLHHGQEDAPSPPPFPFREVLKVEGYNPATNNSIIARFILEVYETNGMISINSTSNSNDNNTDIVISQSINNTLENNITIDNRNSDSNIDIRRYLLDTYGSSLVHVNKLYRKKFGSENRRVPAHMPHFLDIEMVEKMHSLLPLEWNMTSSNKFRDPNDMQFAFSYYYYSMNRYKDTPINLTVFINNEIDTNHDGIIDNNEFRTLVTVATGKSPNDNDLKEFYKCAKPNTTDDSNSNTTQPIMLTANEILSCNTFENGIRVHPMWNRWAPTHTIGQDKDVSFEMISDNATETLFQLDSVRARLTKFICINDNMKNPTSELEKILKDFFEALFPIPSPFELPHNVINPTLYLDEYNKGSDLLNKIKKYSKLIFNSNSNNSNRLRSNNGNNISYSNNNSTFHLILLWSTVVFCWMFFIRKRN